MIGKRAFSCYKYKLRRSILNTKYNPIGFLFAIASSSLHENPPLPFWKNENFLYHSNKLMYMHKLFMKTSDIIIYVVN